MTDVAVASASRMFLIPGGAQPGNHAVYKGFWRAGAISWTQGTSTAIRRPSDTQYRRFITVDTVPGEQGLPELPVTALYTFDLSEFLEFIRKGNCDQDLQLHWGSCQNPKDFNGGYDKVVVLEAAHVSDYSTSDLGALDSSEDAAANETPTMQGQDLYEIKKLTATELFSATITREIVDVAVCDTPNCGGNCGDASDGCQIVFFLSVSAGASPGLPADIIASNDGGGTNAKSQVTTLAVGEAPNALACVGSNLVVVSEDSESLHYAPIADLLLGTATWSEVTTGFVSTKGPLAISSIGPSETWIAAEGGYIYFTSSPGSGVTVQSAGTATTEDLNAIHMLDSTHGVAVGNSNAVLRTVDGTTWGSVVGPSVGVNLTAVWMKTADIWIVGNAAGNLYYTRNAGTSWSQLGFTGQGAGAVRDIAFSNNTVGFMSHSSAAPAGTLHKTIDGGDTWEPTPELSSLPANDRVTALAACAPNVVYGGGLADNGSDGFAVKLT